MTKFPFILILVWSQISNAQIKDLEEIYIALKEGNFSEASNRYRSYKCEDEEACFKGSDATGKELEIMPEEVRLDIALFKSIKFGCDQSGKSDLKTFNSGCYQGIKTTRERKKLERIKRISGVNMEPFFVPYEQRLIGLQKMDSAKKAVEAKEIEKKLAEKNAEEQKARELEKIRNSPEGKKCDAMSDVISSKKILLLLDKNLATIKKDAQDVGVYTTAMQQEIDKTLGMRKAYTARQEASEAKVRSLSNVTVDEKRCKQIFPGYGNSPADQYLNTK